MLIQNVPLDVVSFYCAECAYFIVLICWEASVSFQNAECVSYHFSIICLNDIYLPLG